MAGHEVRRERRVAPTHIGSDGVAPGRPGAACHLAGRGSPHRGGLTGTQSVVPDLFLSATLSAISDSGSTLNGPISLVVDLDGTLYVGNSDFEVSRFDDAHALEGLQAIEASAYLDTGIDFNYMVALDQSGALWVGHYYGELVRLTDPTSYTGYADVSGDFDLQLSWLTASASGSPDGGTLTFVPTQGRHAGY